MKMNRSKEWAVARIDGDSCPGVLPLEDLAAERTLPLIERAFAAGLTDDELYPLADLKEAIVKGDEIFEETLARLRHPDGLIDHLQRWADFDDLDSDGDDEVDDFPDEHYT